MVTAPVSSKGRLNSSRIWPNSDIIRVSRLTVSASPISQRSPLRTWLTSCASTPDNSRSVRERIIPSVTAMAASPRRPMAKAFSVGLGIQ